ncbi:hypothetical protein GCM10023224_25970 [Streptomonospora halophila]|uniref:Transposase DDE domain-containing protein n=1 Tax=Streptomonospora halophila TaxID=427369 RepID=A0ABP9GHF0_9ACTN
MSLSARRTRSAPTPPPRSGGALPALRGLRLGTAQPADQRAHRRRKGSAGGRPPAFDRRAYRGRNTVERAINLLK